MKRSGSRASKMSVSGLDTLENSLPDIPGSKWNEFLEEEDTDLFILSVREEIVNDCLKICYEKYMERQAVAFTVHCAYKAWAKVLDIYYMFRDPGDTDDPKVRESWEPDEEPQPCIIDSWASQCIRPMSLEPKQPKERSEVELSVCLNTPEEQSLKSCSFISDLFDEGEGEFDTNQYRMYRSGSWFSSGRKSIFTRTLSMSRESLLLVEPLTLYQGTCGDMPRGTTKKRGDSKRVTPEFHY